jgi:hypothetical protein
VRYVISDAPTVQYGGNIVRERRIVVYPMSVILVAVELFIVTVSVWITLRKTHALWPGLKYGPAGDVGIYWIALSVLSLIGYARYFHHRVDGQRWRGILVPLVFFAPLLAGQVALAVMVWRVGFEVVV